MKYSTILTSLISLIKEAFTVQPQYIFVETQDYNGVYYVTKRLSDSGVYMSLNNSASRDKDEAYAVFVHVVKGNKPRATELAEYTVLTTSKDID